MAVEVLSNHHFGPKRSMAVVKVGGRTLVVGITEQSINLISQLSSEEDAMNALVEFDDPPLEDNTGSFLSKPSVGATVAGPAVFAQSVSQSFSKTLQSEAARPATTSAVAKPRADVRVTSYGTSMGAGATAKPAQPAPGLSNSRNVSAQAAMGLSGVRAQIKNKLDGLKEI
jgi:flagellar biogenesis protein FliO